MENNYIKCKVFNIESVVFLIPMDKIDEFETTRLYDREEYFREYIVPEDLTLEDVLVDSYEFDCMVRGDY